MAGHTATDEARQMGKGSETRARARKLAKRKRQPQSAPAPKVKAAEPIDRGIRPTIERLKRGKWAMPTGMGKHDSPAVNLMPDAVGVMYESGYITTQQEQAARTVQRAYAEYVRELGVSQGRSCLDISPVGHDEGDGNPEAMREWRSISGKLSYWQRGALEWTVINNHAPGNLELLRSALDAVAGIRAVAAE